MSKKYTRSTLILLILMAGSQIQAQETEKMTEFAESAENRDNQPNLGETLENAAQLQSLESMTEEGMALTKSQQPSCGPCLCPPPSEPTTTMAATESSLGSTKSNALESESTNQMPETVLLPSMAGENDDTQQNQKNAELQAAKPSLAGRSEEEEALITKIKNNITNLKKNLEEKQDEAREFFRQSLSAKNLEAKKLAAKNLDAEKSVKIAWEALNDEKDHYYYLTSEYKEEQDKKRNELRAAIEEKKAEIEQAKKSLKKVNDYFSTNPISKLWNPEKEKQRQEDEPRYIAHINKLEQKLKKLEEIEKDLLQQAEKGSMADLSKEERRTAIIENIRRLEEEVVHFKNTNLNEYSRVYYELEEAKEDPNYLQLVASPEERRQIEKKRRENLRKQIRKKIG